MDEKVWVISIQRFTEQGFEYVEACDTLEDIPSIIKKWYDKPEIEVIGIKIVQMKKVTWEYLSTLY
jgi:hypothetical protein